MTNKQIVKAFDSLVPNPKCELDYKSPYELLIAVILSAQCTDKRVNMVTEQLFKTYNTPEKMLTLTQQQLGQLIHSCGFYNAKSKAILEASKDIVEKFSGKVPQTMEELTSLCGVGRKTANVMISEAFKGDAFAVDTHILRISNRLGLTRSKDPDKVEEDLKNFFDKKDWSHLHYQMVLFGRYKCKAIKPDCENCPFQKICIYYNKKEG